MKYIDEFCSPEAVDLCRRSIARNTSQPWTIMEVCGSQTNTIVKNGLESLLPDSINLIHGPGCPVCVTPTSIIDHAVELALRQDCIVCSFGDMLNVPGSSLSLLQARAQGGKVQLIYSPTDTLKIAAQNCDKQVVLLAIGFETTAPLNAHCIVQAEQQQLRNFSVLVSQVTVPPAIRAIMSNPRHNIDAFLAAGHVCTIMGESEYAELAEEYQVPIAITGFEPLDIMLGINHCIAALEQGTFGLMNSYKRSVKPTGNHPAQAVLNRVFEIADQQWRGIGCIPNSGLVLREEYKRFDASLLHPFTGTSNADATACISGEVLQGLKRPSQCPSFGTQCTPEHPLGAPMVSSEGACAAYYNYSSDAL